MNILLRSRARRYERILGDKTRPLVPLRQWRLLRADLGRGQRIVEFFKSDLCEELNMHRAR